MKNMRTLPLTILVFAVLACQATSILGGQAGALGKASIMSTNPNLPSKVSVIVLGVTSISKSVSFYRDILGLEVSGQSGDLAFLSMSGITLMLSADLGRSYQPIAGATEIVFPVESVTAAYSLLNQRGCKFINEPREVTPGSFATTFIDPDGHKLTVFGPR